MVTAFLKAGVPLNKVDCFRELLEESSYRLTASQNLSEMIPFIRNVEREKLKKKSREKSFRSYLMELRMSVKQWSLFFASLMSIGILSSVLHN